MDWLINLPPAWREYFLGSDGASDGLVDQLVRSLLSTARRQVCERFRSPAQTRALQNAVAAALDAALNGWTIEDVKAVTYRDLFQDWLLHPAVGISQFGHGTVPKILGKAVGNLYAAISRAKRSSVLASVSTTLATLSMPLIALRIDAEASRRPLVAARYS
jgi:hypothetical protein